MQKNNFTFLWDSAWDYCDYMFFDIRKYRNIHYKNMQLHQTWNEKRKACSILFGNSLIGKYIFGLLLKNELKIKVNCNNYLIVSEDYLRCIDWEEMQFLKTKYNIVTVLYIADPVEKRMNIKKNRLKEYKEKFNLIVCTDIDDARKFNISFFPLIYSKPALTGKANVCYDLSFVGHDKGRWKLLDDINKKMQSKGLKTFVRCRKGRITDQKWMAYSEIIDIVKKSNCILEIVQEGQTAITLRTLEAIYYKKKLLTNNINIKKYSFYDPRYIQVFTKLDDIDCNFIKEKTEIHYKYHNECSPVNLLRYIVKKMNNIHNNLNF